MFESPSNVLLSNGVPIPHPYESQRAGENGPLLQDLLSHFDRERIPERVVHAKGSGAHGYFECTNPTLELTAADIFSAKGKKCPSAFPSSVASPGLTI
jgi:catalase